MTQEVLPDSILDLSQLARGLPGITPDYGSALAEAAAVCFEDRKHASGVGLGVDGSFNVVYPVFWNPVTDQMRHCWNDLTNATEHGAYGVAFLLLLRLSDYTVLERARKRTGFDYWLGAREDDNQQRPFQDKARLEVSGILQGGASDIAARVRQKLNQVQRAGSSPLPIYVVVVEFGTPLSRVVRQ